MTGKTPSWHLIPKTGYREIESFLREREPVCVGACSRFISGNTNVWTIKADSTTAAYGGSGGSSIAGLLLHSRNSLYPIFTGSGEIPLPKFLTRFLRRASIHSVQGLCSDTEKLEQGMESRGYKISDRIDYDLMTLDSEPLPGSFKAGPVGLVLRKPAESDTEALFRLHSAYEQEEVIPAGGYFNPDNSLKTLKKILYQEQILIACLDGEIAGKINTNAKSFTRAQIGGVYVRPEFRGLGIAARMSAEFMKQLFADYKGISLYVKKRNAAAKSVYRRLGFTVSGDFRISYY
ncbi:MAG: GNAT family N-acetyltransferase [Treponema sp.]|nr:GNAT family N-acetyltransferase [Treponema sp.]